MHDTSSAEALELFEATFQEAPMGIAHVAPDGTWLRVNRHLCEMLGYPEHELLVLERCGHFAHLEQPRRTLEAVGDFFDRVG